MGFGQAIQTCFLKYVTFTGRARRSEYWWFVLFSILVSIFLEILIMIAEASVVFLMPILAAVIIISLGVMVPSISVGVRRLHDINKSGWWVLLPVTVIGTPILLYWMCLDSRDDNQYGPNPKQPVESTA